MRAQWFDFPARDGDGGRLTFIEKLPFAIARVYYIENVPPAARRGFHAHKNLQQAAVALRGHCTFLLDDGREKTECRLDNPRRALLIDKMIWREFYDCGDDFLLLVLANLPFDESDYIRDYGEFLARIKKQ